MHVVVNETLVTLMVPDTCGAMLGFAGVVVMKNNEKQLVTQIPWNHSAYY